MVGTGGVPRAGVNSCDGVKPFPKVHSPADKPEDRRECLRCLVSHEYNHFARIVSPAMAGTLRPESGGSSLVESPRGFLVGMKIGELLVAEGLATAFPACALEGAAPFRLTW